MNSVHVDETPEVPTGTWPTVGVLVAVTVRTEREQGRQLSSTTKTLDATVLSLKVDLISQRCSIVLILDEGEVIVSIALTVSA